MGAITGTATIVFTDLEDSTRLRAALGEHGADELRRDHDAALARVVVAHRGRLVKGAGDGILATFESASDGVLAAVAMQQAVHELARRRRLSLGLRVGLSTGDVSWEDADCFGLPVVEAARLVGVAEPGRILAAEIVLHLAHGRAGVEVGAPRRLTLKGLTDAVVVREIGWAPVSIDGASTDLALVGRDVELATIVDAWHLAAAGSGGALLVAGEPGIGKTRLLDEAASRVASAGGVVWRGSAYEGEGRAYGAVAEMLDGYVRVADPRQLGEDLGRSAGLVARLAPALRDVLEVDEPVAVPVDAEQSRTVESVVELIGAIGARAPLMMAVDDAHWADTSTIALLRTLVRRAAHLPVLIVVAYRDVDLDRRHPLADALSDWRRSSTVGRIALGGLDERAVRELLVDLADQDDVPSGLVSAITSETDGNPFFVREVIFNLVEEGHIRQVEGRWVADPVAELGIPEGVREAIGRRLSRLSADADALLSVASGFDAAFLLGDVAAVAGLDDSAALDALDEALRAQIVRPSVGFDRYEFTHALFRHTLWTELNPSRQVRLHRAIAEQIEQRTNAEPQPDDAISLARHFHRSAALPGAERGVRYALFAADHAAAQFAANEEHQAVEIALELVGQDDERLRALCDRAARAAVLSGDWRAAVGHARRSVDLALAAGGPEAACRLAVEIGRLAETVEVNAGWPFGHLVDEQRSSIDSGGEVGVQLLAWEVAETEFLDPDNPGIPAESLLRHRMNDLAGLLPPGQRPTGPGGYLYPSAAAYLEDYRAGFSALGIGMSFTGPGLYREAIAVIRRRIDILTTIGHGALAVYYLGLLGRIHLVLGDLDRAAHNQAEGEPLLERVDPDSNVHAQFSALAAIRSQFVDDDPAETLRLLEPMVARSRRTDLRWVAAGFHAWRSSARATLGAHEESMAEIDTEIAAVERGFLGAPNYPVIVSFTARILWCANRSDHVDVLERNLRTKVLEPDFSYLESDGRWTAALLSALDGHPDDARRWFTRAHERLAAQQAILLIPHMCCDEALMEIRLGNTGDRRLGRRRLDEARRWIDHIRLPGLLPRVDNLDNRLHDRSASLDL